MRDAAAIDEIRAQMDLECTAIYDKQSLWTSALQSFIVSRAGEAAHDVALSQAGEHAFQPAISGYAGRGFRERVTALARHLRASGSTFWVTDEGDRLRFRLDPWGSVRLWRSPESPALTRDGSRIVYRSQNAFGPAGLSYLHGAGPLTQGRTGVPCFFAAEILFYEIRAIELLGVPLAVITLPHGADDPAYLDVYKDPREIPTEAFECLGLTKPRDGLPSADNEPAFAAAELDALGTPLSLQVEACVASDDWSGIVEIAAGMDVELVTAKDPLNLLNLGLLTWIARNLGEDEAEHALARAAEVVMGPAIDAVKDLDFGDAIRQFAMVWRAHGSTFWIEETDDTIVMRGRPMGACGRLWSHRYQTNVERISDSRVRYTTWGAYDPPASNHVLREARPIGCGKPGMPIYSCHCHMFHEIFPIQRIGRPLWVEEHPVDDNNGETVHIHYKDYAAWPERYYTRVGLAKSGASR